MEIETMEKPEDKAPRWMNDNDLGRPLILTYVRSIENGQVELGFQTPLLENIRRTTSKDKAEYAFIYNNVQDGNKVFKYVKKNGYRTPEIA